MLSVVPPKYNMGSRASLLSAVCQKYEIEQYQCPLEYAWLHTGLADILRIDCNNNAHLVLHV